MMSFYLSVYYFLKQTNEFFLGVLLYVQNYYKNRFNKYQKSEKLKLD